MRAFWASWIAWGLYLPGILERFGSFERFLAVEKWWVRIVKREFEMGMAWFLVGFCWGLRILRVFKVSSAFSLAQFSGFWFWAVL